MRKALRQLFILSLMLSISACGFSLRGSDILSSKFNSVILDSQQPNSEFTRLLNRSLEISEVEVMLTSPTEPGDDLPVLTIRNEQIINRPITVNPRARAAQYEIRLSVDIAFINSTVQLIEPETLFVERSYFEDIENIIGNREEVEIIAAEMRRELVNQLIRRLAAVEL
ncbi:MAG: hypothetical protein COA96_13220 [SAR86 cluster bacterium]|uniref:LPS-assembly lipoprotein LptE n=1 Tax=SAR86 cluster bacterium TaxID=2030880 RepID=A0A2A5AUC6_9GAMM|nr:MAG: hypothetical protein COA96_13220 [SAR86 cluster bacterium]